MGTQADFQHGRTKPQEEGEMSATGKYHYEWVAYTDNLCYGRILINRGRDRDAVYLAACCANKGTFIVVKQRVYEN